MSRLYHYTLLRKVSYKTVPSKQSFIDFYSKSDWNTGKRNSKFATTHVIGFVQYTDCGSRTVSHGISYSRAAVTVHVTVEATYYTAFIFTSGNVIWSVAHSWRTLNVTWYMPLSVQSAIARKSFYRLWAIVCPITQPLTRFSLSDWRFVVHLLHWRSQEEDVKKALPGWRLRTPGDIRLWNSGGMTVPGEIREGPQKRVCFSASSFAANLTCDVLELEPLLSVKKPMCNYRWCLVGQHTRIIHGDGPL